MTDEIKQLKNEIKIWEEQSLKKLEETSLNLERIKTLEKKVKELEDELAKEKLSYTSLKLRANRAETQLKVIKNALNL
jgi:predicted S18 family serine protease